MDKRLPDTDNAFILEAALQRSRLQILCMKWLLCATSRWKAAHLATGKHDSAPAVHVALHVCILQNLGTARSDGRAGHRPNEFSHAHRAFSSWSIVDLASLPIPLQIELVEKTRAGYVSYSSRCISDGATMPSTKDRLAGHLSQTPKARPIEPHSSLSPRPSHRECSQRSTCPPPAWIF